MKEVRQTKMPELSPAKPAEVTERRPGERSEPGRSGVTSVGVNLPGPLPASVPNPEVLAKPLRRRFTAEDKLRILKSSEAMAIFERAIQKSHTSLTEMKLGLGSKT